MEHQFLLMVLDHEKNPENKYYYMTLLNSLEIEEKIDKTNPNTISFIFHHLPAGLGTTVGNYLRRFLLSYLSGVASAGIKIRDKNGPIKSKFTTIAGVVETTPYLILNLKKIVLTEKKVKDGIFSLELKVENKEKNERIITAKDFAKIPEVEIKNPELYLATLAPGGILEISMLCRKDWGYQPIEEQKKKYFPNEEDIIVLDTDYSPIKGGQVNFQVKSVVIGLEEKEEELELIITTNGAIKPKNALNQVLEDSQNLFGNISKLILNKKETVVTENK